MTPRVLYFGTYDQGIGRNAILREGLAAAGIPLAECHAPLWRDTAAKLATVRQPAAAVRLAARLAAAWPRLVACRRRAGPYDVLLVGATGHLDLPLARLLAGGRLLVFDPLVSLGETVRDRGLLAPDSRRLAAMARLERSLFALADVTLVDTAAHARALAAEVGLDLARAVVLPVGAPSALRAGAPDYGPSPTEAELRVVYFGQHIPLHGLDTVLGAAERLQADQAQFGRPSIQLILVGVGQTLPEVTRQVAERRLANVRLVPEWLSLEQLLAEHIVPADVCLGVFGDQPKARRIVPFKVYAALAAGRAVVTAHTPAVAELLMPGEEVWTVPAADPAALAAALVQLANDPGLRLRLARAGRAAFDQRFAPPVLGRQLRDALVERLADRGRA